MAPQRPTMSASVRGSGEEGFDRESLKTSRRNAPSFSNGLLNPNKLIAVAFPRRAYKSIMCHTDILRFWSRTLRALIDEVDTAGQETLHDSRTGKLVAALVSARPPASLSVAVITLSDVQPQTFSIFLDWAYSGKLPDTKPLLNRPAPADTDESESNASFYYRQPEAKFLEAYIFGHRYHIREFRNDIFDCLYEVVTWRKVGKEGDASGNLVPSLLLVHRALSVLPYEDPVCRLLVKFASWFLPTGNSSKRENDCATELEQYWGIVIFVEGKKGVIRKGPSSAAALKGEHDEYCENFHQHLGDEHAECWAHAIANDSSGGVDEKKEGSDSDTDGANSKMDEDTEENGDSDVSMDEGDEVEKGEDEQELPKAKSFSVWGCDESASEDWDGDYENSSSGYDSDESKEGEDEGEEEGGDVVSELVDVEDPHIGGTDTGSEAERYQYAW